MNSFNKISLCERMWNVDAFDITYICNRIKKILGDHNLKKLRTALNMITGQISEADKPEQVEGMKVWHKLVQEKFAKMNIDESKASLPMKNRVKAVRSGIEICNEVYEDEVL